MDLVSHDRDYFVHKFICIFALGGYMPNQWARGGQIQIEGGGEGRGGGGDIQVLYTILIVNYDLHVLMDYACTFE